MANLAHVRLMLIVEVNNISAESAVSAAMKQRDTEYYGMKNQQFGRKTRFRQSKTKSYIFGSINRSLISNHQYKTSPAQTPNATSPLAV